jgi:hypothetical protein
MIRPDWAAQVAWKGRMLETGRASRAQRPEMKKPLIQDRINGFGIWLRGQDLNL